MRKNRLVHIINSCSKAEIRGLKKWLKSPIHNQREDVIILFQHIINENNIQNDDYLTKENAFKHIFGNEKYSDAKMRQVIHFLLKTVEEYLIYTEFRKDEIRAKLKLMNLYTNRNLEKSANRIKKNINTLLEEHPHRNEIFMRNYYKFQEEKNYQHSNFSKKRTVPANLQEISDALDASFLAEKLRQACFMLAHQKVFKTQYEIGFINEVLRYAESGNFKDFPAISIYYYGYKCTVEKDNDENFVKLKEEIIRNGSLFPADEMNNILLLAINYCIGKINAGSEEFMSEALDIYKEGLETKVMLEHDKLSKWAFGNITAIALRLKEYEWTKNFIEHYQIYIEEVDRKSTVGFNLAKLHYEQGQYSEAMELLVKTDFQDILISLSARTMLSKMLYEEGEYETLESQLESMRNYMMRKKVIGYHKANYKNIIRFMKKLLNTNPYSKAKKEILRQEIEEAKPLTERDWFIKMTKI